MAWDKLHKTTNSDGKQEFTVGYASETITLGDDADSSTSILPRPITSDITVLVVFSAELTGTGDTYIQVEHSWNGTTWVKQGEFESDGSPGVDDISKNTGLRSARLSYYIAKDLINQGDIEEAVKEFNNMLDGLEQSYIDFRREQSTQFFMKIHSETLAKIFSKISRRDLLTDLKQLDPDNNELYQIYLDKMSK